MEEMKEHRQMQPKGTDQTQDPKAPERRSAREEEKNSNIKKKLGELGEDIGDRVSNTGRELLEDLFTTFTGWMIILSVLGFVVIWIMWGFWWAVILLAVVWGAVLVKNMIDD